MTPLSALYEWGKGPPLVTPATLASMGLCCLVTGCVDPLDFGEVCPLRSPEISVTVVAEAPPPVLSGCPQLAELEAVGAVLEIEGLPRSTMAVAVQTLRATTTVHDLPIEQIYPILVTFTGSTGAGLRVLAYRWSVIDLEGPECLYDSVLDQPERLLASPAEVESLLAGGVSEEGEDRVVTAGRRFAREQLDGEAAGLDTDHDGCSNLAEACGGTLDSPAHLESCTF